MVPPALRLPLAVSLGAVAGAVSRYGIVNGLNVKLGTSFPFGTLTVNLIGALGMGVVARFVASPERRALLATGFLGSLTTFSAYQLDAETLSAQRLELLFLYWFGSAALGVICVELGTRLPRSWLGRGLYRG